jgi:SARP family transcriptional regulator, regulator of embCAB operon
MDARIQICGRVVVQIDGRRLESALPGRQGTMLLVYLAANRDRLVARDELMEALWPYELPARPDSALSALLSKLRSVLGPEAVEGRSEVRLAMPRAVIDLESAASGLHHAESAVGLEDWAGAWGPARVALHTVSRGMLDGFDSPWISELRARLEEMRLRALWCIGTSSLHLGGPELPAAERAARQLVKLSPFSESGHLLLMRALVAQGDVADALRVYEDLRLLLRDELGTTPSTSVQALHRALLSQGVSTLPQGTVTIMFADIVDSTARTERIGDAAFHALARTLDGSVRAIIAQTGGVAVDGRLLGDGLMAVFTSASQAIECGIRTSVAGADIGLGLHVGLHAGDVIRDGDNVYGGAVNIAARVAALAPPGEVLISETVRSLARTSATVGFESRGVHELKGVEGGQALFAIVSDSEGSTGSRAKVSEISGVETRRQ